MMEQDYISPDDPDANGKIAVGTANAVSEVSSKVSAEVGDALETFRKLKVELEKEGWSFKESFHTIDEATLLVPIEFGIFELEASKKFTGCDDGDIVETYKIGYCDRWHERAAKYAFIPFLKIIKEGDY